MQSVAPVLEISHLTKTFGSYKALDGVDVVVPSGSVYGFLGPNGAGKTTTIRTVLDFIRPSSGSVKVFGLDSVRGSIAIKKQLGYLAGDVSLYGNMTGRQLLRYLTDLGRKTDWAYMGVLAKKLGADVKKPIDELSKGNRQKIGLIQAFMHHPKLVILDEPTSGLDPLVQESFYELVTEAKAAGTTVFLSSHNLSEVQKICDRAAFIRNGRVVQELDIASLLTAGSHTFNVVFKAAPKVAEIKKIPGCSQVALHMNTATMVVTGSPSPLLAYLAKHEVVGMSVQEASLEDTFLQFYGGGGA